MSRVDSTRPRRPGSSSQGPEGWNGRLLSCGTPSLLQTRQWAELKGRFGWSALRVEVEAGMAQVLLRRTPAGAIAYVPHGPCLAGPAAQALPEMLPALHAACRAAGALALKLEPNWPDAAISMDLLRDHGFLESAQTVQPRSTVLVDIEGEEGVILGRMHSKTRYNVRLAERKGVRVRAGGEGDLPAFAALLRETSARDSFGVHSPAYYATALSLFGPPDMASLLLAEHEGQPLAGVMTFAFGGTAYYLYGASSNEGRNLMPTYALQWQAMRWARERGCRVYDLWGIPDEVGRDPAAYMDSEVPAREGLWGVWRFKRGFGGQVTRYVGAWDYVYRPLAYRLYTMLLRLRRATGGIGGG